MPKRECKAVTVSREEMQELQRLKRIINDGQQPIAERRIAKAQYAALVRLAKVRGEHRVPDIYGWIVIILGALACYGWWQLWA